MNAQDKGFLQTPSLPRRHLEFQSSHLATVKQRLTFFSTSYNIIHTTLLRCKIHNPYASRATTWYFVYHQEGIINKNKKKVYSQKSFHQSHISLPYNTTLRIESNSTEQLFFALIVLHNNQSLLAKRIKENLKEVHKHLQTNRQ